MGECLVEVGWIPTSPRQASGHIDRISNDNVTECLVELGGIIWTSNRYRYRVLSRAGVESGRRIDTVTECRVEWGWNLDVESIP